MFVYHSFLVKVQTNYRNNYPLTLDVKQLNKTIKIYYFRNLSHCGMTKVKLRCIMRCPGLTRRYQKKRSIIPEQVEKESKESNF